MTEKQGAANCRWAAPTLLLNTPDWVDADNRPWSCMRDETPHQLESTQPCSTCVRWEQPAAPSKDQEPTLSESDL